MSDGVQLGFMVELKDVEKDESFGNAEDTIRNQKCRHLKSPVKHKKTRTCFSSENEFYDTIKRRSFYGL